MRKLIVLFILLTAVVLSAVEKIELVQDEPFPLRHWLTPEEAARWEEVGRDFYETDPPAAPVHNVAEFEKMEGVLVRYPFGIPVSLIAAMSQHTKVITAVSNTSQQNTVTSQYNSNGVNMDNCEFLIAPTDSYWTRDYGPWYVIDGNGDFGITNFPYNRPRPNDNDIPIEMADFLEINLFGMNVTHTGGNYMTDGLGISASTTLVYDENSISNGEVNQRMLDYLGIQTYYVVDDPNNTYIDHIDCWGKFLDVDKILIREVAPSHPQYDEIEEVADFFSEQTSSYGNNYQVFRVYTPSDQPYSNSLILNDYVYVPITGGGYDDDAIAAYEEAMPGYTIVGVPNGPQIWESTDALHCRTKGIADREMLYIYHMPYLDEQPVDVDMTVSCEITAYSGADIIDDQVFLNYRSGGNNYEQLVMANVEDNTFEAVIPGQPEGSIISYYISAIDMEGNTASHPFIGEPDPHVYYAGGQQPPNLEVEPQNIDLEMTANANDTRDLLLTNSGGGVINYSLEFQDTSRNISGSYVECNEEYFSPGESITLSFNAYNNSNDSEWINSVEIDFPEGFDITGASDFWGGSGGMMYYEGAQGNGALVTWFGETSNGWGVLHEGESATGSVYIEVAPDFSGNAVLNWSVSGDGYGSDPHTVSGEIELAIYGGPVNWVSASQLGGDLWAQETDSIELTFDSTELTSGVYSCNLIITSDAVDEQIIPINLTITGSAADDDALPLIPQCSVFPNPLYPASSRVSSKLRFSLSQPADNVSLNVYNIKGQKVAQIYNGSLTAGEHVLNWCGEDQNGTIPASGVYFYLLQADDVMISQKFILMK